MKTCKFIMVCFVVNSLVLSCGSAKSKATPEQINTLNTLVSNKQFIIESDWAYPQASMAMQQVSDLLGSSNNAGAINLTSNTNFLKIKGDSITSHLPYFGERQMNVGYGGSDSAITFKGLIANYTTHTNKNNSTSIEFDATSNSEVFTVTITLWPNLNSEMVFNSSSRNSIRYSGKAMALKE